MSESASASIVPQEISMNKPRGFGILLRQCAYCRRYLGVKLAWYWVFGVTSGICKACLERELAKLGG